MSLSFFSADCEQANVAEPCPAVSPSGFYHHYHQLIVNNYKHHGTQEAKVMRVS